MNSEKPKELIIQEAISEYLVLVNIFAASVLYCENAPASIPNLSITFYSELELHDFLKLIDYDSLCDKGGILIFNDTNTVILCNLAVQSFLNKIWESSKIM